jgi:hypothetical protein
MCVATIGQRWWVVPLEPTLHVCCSGWPGVVVVEGEESAVNDYVRTLAGLRWQQMVRTPPGARDLHRLISAAGL